ncbi:MAG: TRL-like family protein [Planctomycetota bacterium]
MRLLAPLCLGAALLLSSCSTLPMTRGAFPGVPVAPPAGWLYSAYKAPLMTNMEETSASATKTGKATTMFIRIIYAGLDFAFDDASLEAAARNGGITKIHYADYEVTTVLGLFGKFTTIVHGE